MRDKGYKQVVLITFLVFRQTDGSNKCRTTYVVKSDLAFKHLNHEQIQYSIALSTFLYNISFSKVIKYIVLKK